MNNVQLVENLALVIEGLTNIKDALSVENADKVTKSTNVAVEDVAEEKEEIIDISAMKYNELKKYGAKLGVNCKGTRKEIEDRIYSKLKGEDEVSEEVVSEKPVEKVDIDEYVVLAKEVLEDTEVEDVLDALKEVGIRATSKNVREKLAEAFREGLIELDEYGEETEEVDADAEAEITPQDYYEEFDPEGYNNPDGMTDERKEAVEALMQGIIDKLSSDEKTLFKEAKEFISDFATDSEKELLEGYEDDLDMATLCLFAELNKRMIDDDGDLHEPSDPYEIGDLDMCCGHELSYIEETGNFVCEICGEEYETEE